MVCVIMVVWFFTKSSDKENAETALQEIVITTGDIEEVVTAQGKLEPKEYVDVGTQVSGLLKTISVNIGTNVQKGDLLAEVDPRIYEFRLAADQSRLQTLKAQQAEQEAQWALAQRKHTRNKNLIDSKSISQELLDESEAQNKVAQAGVEATKAQIDEIQATILGDQTNLSYTKIYAPITGTVVLLNGREGQTLNANQTAPIILQLANLDVMTVRSQVAEADVMRLRNNMPVYFTTLGALERRWQGTVRQILPSPEIINDVVLYNVLIDVDNRDRQLMTGMSTQVFFVLGEAKSVPVVPIEALSIRAEDQDNQSGKAYRVQLVSDKGKEEKIVHVGLTDRTHAQVIDGLAVGDRVLLTAHNASHKDKTSNKSGYRMGPH